VDEEAGFIAAMLADPHDRTALLVYADWLDECNELAKAAYLRLLAAEGRDHPQVIAFRARLDYDWVQLIASRGFAVGDSVRYSECTAAMIVEINVGRTLALVEFATPGYAARISRPFTELWRLDGPPTRAASGTIRPVKPRRPPRPRRERS
jgi:uncharacterized protein (TIGR02996 family)